MKKAKILNSYQTSAGIARIFSLSEPMQVNTGAPTNYVLISSVSVPYEGPETFIFPCDKAGNVTCWSMQKGSYKGGLDYVRALKNAGYYCEAP